MAETSTGPPPPPPPPPPIESGPVLRLLDVAGNETLIAGPALKAEEGEDAMAFMQRVETWIETEMRIIDAEAHLD